MARELRPRKSRPSYAAFIDSDNEATDEDEGSASDDFQPEAGQEENEDMEGDSTNEANIVPTRDHSGMERNKGVQSAKVKQASATSAAKRARASAGLSKTAGRTYNATSTQSVDTRQRTEPIFFRPARVERLSQPPAPFRPSVTTSTNSWNSSKPCADRFTKASGYNIGGGPIWQLLEDRSWWKESQRVEEGETETEGSRRPRVYESVEMSTETRLINEEEAGLYLPKGSHTSNGTPIIKCSFGTPRKNVMKELNIFDSFSMGEHLSEYNTNVFYTGGPVWGLDWCPVYAEDQPHRTFKQYVAVAPLPSETHSTTIGYKCSTSFPACVQIWSYAPEQSSSAKEKEKALESEANLGNMLCELVLCIDCGPAHEIKWCPLPAHDSWAEPSSSGRRKLGLLAGAFEDGSLSIFVVPDPDDLRSADLDKPVFVKLQPIIRIELEETSIWSLDWANSERIAVGCTNGSVAIYDIHGAVINESMRDLLPTHYLPIHQSAVRAVQWIPLPSTSADGLLNFTRSPTMIASGGYDGCQIVTDLRDGYGCIVNRTRDVVLSMAYSHFSEGVIGIDNDYSAKSYSMAPSTLGRGNIIVEAGGPIWSLHTSDHHPFLALGSADGSVVITNMLRSTRRSASTPFLFYKIIQMDYSRKIGEYRMLDHFLPQELPDRSTVTASKKGKKLAAETAPPRTGAQGVGAWSPEVSVTRVAWNNGAGLARAPLLASATASGLCRIDWLLGHFQGNRVPYGGVEHIRFETNNGRQIDDEEDD